MTWPNITIDTTYMDAGTDDASQARAQIYQMALNLNAIKDMLGQPLGPASLDSGGKVPTSQLPTIPATIGGTGQTAYTIGDILYASATGTLTKLAAGSVGYVLKSNGAGVAPSWQIEGGGFVSGTRMSFQQTSAPTGWTKDTNAALNDSIMRIVTGTAGNGGSQAFSTFNALTSVGATTLSSGQTPVHNHRQNASSSSGPIPASWSIIGSGATGLSGGAIQSPGTALFTESSGSGGSHSHSLSLDIKYHDFIIASKD